jgi:hypothetical protein
MAALVIEPRSSLFPAIRATPYLRKGEASPEEGGEFSTSS